ncbi:hypothetical protein LNV07_00540 [Paucibacter oligotrophus]|uniref:Sel1 repeat family protein n=2 Tax=Roseateles oligotrophus TaxID=1769250 RepID=A0ABT2YBV3_9BURK|nr:hypothetical protein [Roseateles oligotrophus]
MNFTLKTETLLKLRAKRLRELLQERVSTPVPEPFNYKDATAYALGHNDLRALRASAQAANEGSPWDEQCTEAERTGRRSFLATRLTEYARRFDVQVEDMEGLIDQWQPTASRAQHPAFSIDEIERMRAAGIPQQAFELLVHYEDSGEEPTAEDLDLFRRGIKSSEAAGNTALTLYMGPLAVRLVNQKTGQAAQLGVALLELLSEASEILFPKVQLAIALKNGWGVAQNLERARSLCRLIRQTLTAGEDVFSSDVGHVEFLMLQGKLHGHSSLLQERKLAFQSFREAADLGSGQAALMVAHYLHPLRPDNEPDMFSGVVPHDISSSERYFELALRRGYNPHTKAFPEGAL